MPVYDETRQVWIFLRNTQTIYEGAENAADPEKVDVLRQNVVSLLEHFPETVAQYEAMGIRVKQLLAREIKTYDDVVTWALSMFNFGPVKPKVPKHVQDTADIVYDDVVIEVKTGRSPVYVIPASPRDSGDYSTLNFAKPGMRERFGPRHPYSKTAFAVQTAAIKKAAREAALAARRTNRPRGRPRRDGLVPGSEAAKEADALKKQKLTEEKAQRRAERAQERAKAKEAAPPAEVIKLAPRRRLIRREPTGSKAQEERRARRQA